MTDNPDLSLTPIGPGSEGYCRRDVSLGLVLPPVLEATDTFEDWRRKRERIRKAWLRLLGPMPERSDLKPEILREERAEDHRRLLIRYETEPGVRVDAYLLLPLDLSKAAPAAVVLHGTNSDHILLPAGLAGPHTRHLGLSLVRRGYAALCPRCFIFGYEEDEWPSPGWRRPRGAEDFLAATKRLQDDHPGWTGMGKMLWDGIRAVDCLLTLPQIDPSRIAAVGHSLGAKEALYLAAFDDRVGAAVASEGGVALPLSNWDAPWYLGDRIPFPVASRFPSDHHELLALVAPRPFLVVGGGESDGEKSRPWMEAAAPVFSLYNKPENLCLLVHGAGHDIPDAAREMAFDWLDRALLE